MEVLGKAEITISDIVDSAEALEGIEEQIHQTNANLEILDNKISGTVSEIDRLGIKMTEIEQTSEGFTATITDLKKDVSEAVSEVDDAKKVATNYLSFTTNGLTIGDMTKTTIGRNVLIDSDSVDIRNGTSILASYGDDYIYLGKNSRYSTIDLCNGIAQLSADEDDDPNLIYNRLRVNAGHGISMETKHLISLNVKYDADVEAYMSVETSIPWTDSSVSVDPLVALGVSGYNNCYSYMHLGQSGIELFSDGSNSSVTFSMEGDTGTLYWHADQTDVDSDIYTDYKIVTERESGLCGKDTSGIDRRLIYTSNSDNCVVGYDFYNNYLGNTHIYGEEVYIYTRNAGIGFRPYHPSGTNTTIRFKGAGYITGSGKNLIFSIPLAKPMVNLSSVSITSAGLFRVRQNNSYLYGSSASTNASPTSYTTDMQGEDFITVTAAMGNNTNATNNSPCGIECDLTIYFY